MQDDSNSTYVLSFFICVAQCIKNIIPFIVFQIATNQLCHLVLNKCRPPETNISSDIVGGGQGLCTTVPRMVLCKIASNLPPEQGFGMGCCDIAAATSLEQGFGMG